jgi:phosphopantothenoylcysteine synthetase/decarboxylase
LTKPVLYVLVCGSPAARQIGRLVDLAQTDGWNVCVVATPDGRKFIDVPALAAQTGHPVRSTYKNPGDPDVLPSADAMILAPGTANSVIKFSLGIADTLPLGLLVEGLGLDLPIVVLPFTNSGMAAHPAFPEAIARLRSWGVAVLWGDDVLGPFKPGTGECYLDEIPWELVMATANRRRRPSQGRAMSAETEPDP